jgi:hypothetical protein
MTMHDEEIRQIDHAALALHQALEAHGDALEPYLDDHLAVLKAEVVRLRRALLGLEMGVLYQDYGAPEELLEQVAAEEALPVEEAAAKAHDLLHQGD